MTMFCRSSVIFGNVSDEGQKRRHRRRVRLANGNLIFLYIARERTARTHSASEKGLSECVRESKSEKRERERERVYASLSRFLLTHITVTQ